MGPARTSASVHLLLALPGLAEWPPQRLEGLAMPGFPGCVLRELFKAVFLGRKEENAN